MFRYKYCVHFFLISYRLFPTPPSRIFSIFLASREQEGNNQYMSKIKERRLYDPIILGNGAAAFAAAIKADELGKSALMIQGGTIGGTCVNVVCVPSKRMLVAGEVIRNTFEHDLGRGAIARHNEKFDFSKILRSKDLIVRAFRKEKYEKVLRGLSNVDVIRGFAEFVSRNEVKVRPLDSG